MATTTAPAIGQADRQLAAFLAEISERMAPEPVIPFGDEEYAARLDRLRAAMAADGIDLLLLSSPEAQCWIHGLSLRWYKAHAPRQWRPLITTAVHVDHDRFILFDGAEHAEVIRRTSMAPDVRLLPRYERDRMLGFILDELRAEGWLAGRVGLERYSYVPSPAVHAEVVAGLASAGCTVVDGTDAVRRVRRVKSPAELACIERAAEIADAGIRGLVAQLHVGMTELEAWAAMMSAMVAAGGEPAALHEFASLGQRAGHAWAGHRRIEPGLVLNVDPCGVVNRYHSNRTGTIFIGDPPAQYLDLMARLAGAYDVLRARASAGTPVREVNAALREYYREVGLWDLRGDTWIGGYELGLSFPPDWVGDWIFTVADEETDEVFEAGMVTNFESIVHFSLIDTLVYEEDGARTLSSLPHELIVVDP
ncbi:ectoine hydrolase DoeA [Nocardioides hungaricus]